jgi:hypothetical protein
MIISRPGQLSIKSSILKTGKCIRHVSTAPTLPNSRIYCQDLVRKYDYSSYLQIPFLPQSARDAHLAIRALNIEMALIPDTVSNENARLMRMQFWKDAVDNCFQGHPKAEPVSILLSQVLSNGTRLTKSFFQSMISERVLSFGVYLTTLVDCNCFPSTTSKYGCPRITSVENNDAIVLSTPRIHGTHVT